MILFINSPLCLSIHTFLELNAVYSLFETHETLFEYNVIVMHHSPPLFLSLFLAMEYIVFFQLKVVIAFFDPFL